MISNPLRLCAALLLLAGCSSADEAPQSALEGGAAGAAGGRSGIASSELAGQPTPGTQEDLAVSVGDRVLFGSIEYRVPVLSSLQTRLFGVISLGATTVSGFADAGAVWSGADFENADRRLGAGVEVKNAIRIGRVFEFSHALGIGWPLYEEPGAENEIYYRIRTSLPF